jgi:proton glutamate symport protein
MSKALIILAALIAGVVLGMIVGDHAPRLVDAADVVGTLWLNAMRMTVVPLVVALLVTGIAQTAQAMRAGRLAARSVVTMIAILWASSAMAALMIPTLIGLFPIPAGSAEAFRAALGTTTQELGTVPPFGDFLRAMIPTNPVNAAASDAILPLIIFTMVFAFAVTRLPPAKRTTIADFFAAIADTMVIMIQWVLALAVIGVFALAFVVGSKAGAAALGTLAHYVVILSALGVIIWVAAFVLAWFGARRSPAAFFPAAAPAMAVAISTQSSLASLPAMLEGVKKLGVREGTADIVLPMAVAIFRATGPAMNFGVALYIAHLYSVPLGPAQIAVGLAAGAITTMGAVSLPGSVSFVSSIAPICIAMGVPIEPLALLIAVETFPDIFRTVGNVTMDMAVTATIDRAHGDDAPAAASAAVAAE